MPLPADRIRMVHLPARRIPLGHFLSDYGGQIPEKTQEKFGFDIDNGKEYCYHINIKIEKIYDLYKGECEYENC